MPTGEDIQVPGMSDEQVDSLVEKTESSPNREVEMEALEPPASPDPKAVDTFEFTHNGKLVKGTREQILKWAQMGYDRPQWQQNFNHERTQFEAQRKQFEAQWQEHKKIDQWAQANPDKWSAIVQSFKNQGQSPAEARASANALDANQIKQMIQSELQQNPVVNEVLTEHQQAKVQREDQALDHVIQGIKESHKDIDFDAVNDQGMTLEQQILNHAITNGIKNFNTAFNDYCHQQLIDRAIAQAKTSVTKTTQANTKLGILGKTQSSQASKRFSAAPKNIRDYTYEDGVREALEEIRAGHAS